MMRTKEDIRLSIVDRKSSGLEIRNSRVVQAAVCLREDLVIRVFRIGQGEQCAGACKGVRSEGDLTLYCATKRRQ